VYGSIYVIRNKVNSKAYVGQTTQKVGDRFGQHCTIYKPYPINLAIKKYGRDNFTVEEVDTANSKDELDAKECEWMARLDCRAPNGYNIKEGGANGKMSPESVRKLSESMKGKNTYRRTDETKDKIRNSLGSQMSSNPGKTSIYKGVGWSARHKKWRVAIYQNSKLAFSLRHESEQICARIYDYMARKYYGKGSYANFPDNVLDEDQFEHLMQTIKAHRTSKKTSTYVGVYYSKELGHYYCSVYENKKVKHLGAFAKPLDAARHREQYIADKKLGCRRNFNESK
jgi:group I intron endonuclease